MVLVHGLATLAQEIITPLAAELGRHGFRVVALDRPGYGFSDPLPRDRNGPADQAVWLGQAIDALGIRLPTVLAHSSGAAPVLCLAADAHRRLTGLVLLSPFSRPTRPAPMPLLRLSTLPAIGPLFRSAVLPVLAPLIGPVMVKTAGGESRTTVDRRAFPWRTMARESAVLTMKGELETFNADMVRLRTRLGRIRCPAVVIADPADPVLDMPAQVRWLQQRLQDIEVRWLVGPGHLAHHSAPSAVASALVYLRGRVAGADLDLSPQGSQAVAAE